MSQLFAGLAASAPPTITGALSRPEPRGQPPNPEGSPFREALIAAQETEGWPAESEASTVIPTEAELAALAALLTAPALPALTLLTPLTAEALPPDAEAAQPAPFPTALAPANLAPLPEAEALMVTAPNTDAAALEADPAPTFAPLLTQATAALQPPDDSPEPLTLEATTDQPPLNRAASTQDSPLLIHLASPTQTAPSVTPLVGEPEIRALDFLPQVQHGLEALTHAGQATLRLQLQPEHLGRLDLQLTTSAEGVRVSIVADQPIATHLLETHIADLRQTLTDAGLTIAGLSVSLNMDSGQAFNMAKWHTPLWLNHATLPPPTTEPSPAEDLLAAQRAPRLGLGHQVDYSI